MFSHAVYLSRLNECSTLKTNAFTIKGKNSKHAARVESSDKEIVMGQAVTVFEPYPFKVGQKIRIEGKNRHGDWEVVAVADSKVTLRCPISHREFEWSNFCYVVEEKQDEVWPQPD